MEEETAKLSRHLEDHDALKQEYDDLRRKLIEVRTHSRRGRRGWTRFMCVCVRVRACVLLIGCRAYCAHR